MAPVDPDDFRGESRATWERNAPGWRELADRMRSWAMPVSVTMVDALALQPGDRVLELAAGPGDTGFMAAELIAPGGSLICSDGAEAMLDVARQRAAAQGIRNVEFKQLELEWIDLETASVDAVLCRWGIMLIVDPDAAAREIRRVLRPGGRAALAVWDLPVRNTWTTLPMAVLREAAGMPEPDPDAPNMFSLAAEGALAEVLEGAGLIDVTVTAVAIPRAFDGVDGVLADTLAISPVRGEAYEGLDEPARAALRERLTAELEPFTDADGSVTLPASVLVAGASA